MTQVEKHLSSKQEALNSTPVPQKGQGEGGESGCWYSTCRAWVQFWVQPPALKKKKKNLNLNFFLSEKIHQIILYFLHTLQNRYISRSTD
jgi:hypothetical protein